MGMRASKYRVCLTAEDRKQLLTMLSKGKESSRIIRRALILLAVDESQGKSLGREEVAKQCHTSTPTVYSVAKQFVQEGLQSTLTPKRKDTQHPQIKITGDVEARIITIACGEVPDGRSRWTVRLLADRAVELGIVESVCPETVRKVLKKRN